jgi:hypothetical protein
MIYLRYSWYVLRHKWWVLYYSIKTGASLRLAIMHDMSKFAPSEFFAYAIWFYGEHGVSDGGWGFTDSVPHNQVRLAFDQAWERHKSRNKHHPEHWVKKDPSSLIVTADKMPTQYVGEMIADWLGAGRAITGKEDLSEWWDKNRTRFVFHPLTSIQVKERLAKLGVR